MARPEIAVISAPEQRVVGLYRLLFGRVPNADEIDLGIRFVAGLATHRRRNNRN